MQPGNIEAVKIVEETGKKLGVDNATIGTASLMAFMGASDSVVPILGAGLNKKLTREAEVNNPKPKRARGYTKLEKTIVDMLTENTGANFLDSGGAYGRQWQRNRGIKDFRELPAFKAEVDWWGKEPKRTWGMLFEIDIFHFLTDILDTDKNTTKWNRRLTQILKNDSRIGYLEAMEQLGDELIEHGEIGRYFTDNTYNHESNLSQTLQITYYELEEDNVYGDYYLALQIHGGADVRGGYTRPRIFKLNTDEGIASMMCMESDINASCNCGSMYSDDHGYHWYIGENKEIEQTDLNGNKLMALTEDKDDKFPREWQPETDKDGCGLRCARCTQPVSFYGGMG